MSLVENTVRKNAVPPQLVGLGFKPGQSGNPAGRPKGSRNKITEAYLAAMHADFVEHGVSVIEKVRERKPEIYLQCIAALVPKQTEKIESPFVDLTDEELNQLEKFLKASRAKSVPPIIDAEKDKS